VTYGLIADIHANHISLKIALEELENLGVDHILAAGDIVGYGGAPNECISLLRKYKVKSVLGNHDFRYMLEMKAKNLESDWPIVLDLIKASEMMNYRPIAIEMIDWQLRRLTADNRHWIGSLPLTLMTDDKQVSVIHGSPPLSMKNGSKIEFQDYAYSLGKYLFPWNDQELSIACYLQPTPVLVIGHTHMQFAHQANTFNEPPIKTSHPCIMKYSDFPVTAEFPQKAPLIINPGSIAQSRDEISAPGFATLTIKGRNKKEVSWFRYKYPYENYENYLKKNSAPENIINRDFWKIQ
jgi:predicted phosphodiesterase